MVITDCYCWLRHIVSIPLLLTLVPSVFLWWWLVFQRIIPFIGSDDDWAFMILVKILYSIVVLKWWRCWRLFLRWRKPDIYTLIVVWMLRWRNVLLRYWPLFWVSFSPPWRLTAIERLSLPGFCVGGFDVCTRLLPALLVCSCLSLRPQLLLLVLFVDTLMTAIVIVVTVVAGIRRVTCVWVSCE